MSFTSLLPPPPPSNPFDRNNTHFYLSSLFIVFISIWCDWKLLIHRICIVFRTSFALPMTKPFISYFNPTLSLLNPLPSLASWIFMYSIVPAFFNKLINKWMKESWSKLDFLQNGWWLDIIPVSYNHISLGRAVNLWTTSTKQWQIFIYSYLN